MLCKLKNVFVSPQSAGKCYKNYSAAYTLYPPVPTNTPTPHGVTNTPTPPVIQQAVLGTGPKPCNARHRVSSEGLQLWIGAAPVDIHVVLVTPAEVTQAKTQHVRVQRAYLVDCFAVCGGHQHAVVAPCGFSLYRITNRF